MGFCDDVTMERAYPEYGVEHGDTFQTKSLYAGGGKFTITVTGDLIEHRYRYEQDPSRALPGFTHLPLKPVHIGDRAISYHGDILLWPNKAMELDDQLVARFTHGTLEWLKSVRDYPEENKVLLLEQGAR